MTEFEELVKSEVKEKIREGVKWVKRVKEDRCMPTEELKQVAWVSDERIYEESIKNPLGFWAWLAKKGLDWYNEWDKVYEWTPPYFKWFIGGRINASYNCLDRHIKRGLGSREALIWIPEPPEESPRTLTYQDIYRDVNRLANALKSIGVKRGDRVVIYLPMIPEVQVALLACARIGAIHSVVFSAFSSDALKTRIVDAGAKALITADGYYRRGKVINLKRQADAGIEGTKVEKVIVVKRLGLDVKMVKNRDYWWHELISEAESYCEPEIMDSEDILYILYTSGTTGKPKGVVHETGGYLSQAHWTTKWIFDLHDEDVYWCTSDIGWVTGHTYNCYGPLLNAATILVYEGAPDYPHSGRVWEIIEKYRVTIFYTAPTLIRMLRKLGEDTPLKYDLSSLRILGTVGEPIDRGAWMWYFEKVGGERCPIVDTWWQTETGGILISSLPGIGPFIPTVAGRSFPGTIHLILDDEGKPVRVGEEGYLVQASPFAPGMLRGIWKDPKKYVETYWSRFGTKYYFTGDGAKLLEEFIACTCRIIGRVDDVLKVAGHRLSTGELEDVLNGHEKVAETAIVGIPHEIKGSVPVAFVVLKEGVEPSEKLERELIDRVNRVIGPIAKPAKVYFVKDLPKTRSGKIMRRMLRNLLKGEPLGDVTTLMNPESIEEIKQVISESKI